MGLSILKLKRRMLKIKDKEKFFKREYKEYIRLRMKLFTSFFQFKAVMKSEVTACETCGIYYWINCKKNCKCK